MYIYIYVYMFVYITLDSYVSYSISIMVFRIFVPMHNGQQVLYAYIDRFC